MPKTDDLQDAVEDLGAQLEAEFANRFADVESQDDDSPAEDVDGQPPAADGDAGDPAAGSATPPADPAADQPPATPAGLRLDLDGQEFVVTEDHARRLVGLQAWAEALPDDVREQFAGIEAGSQVAVPKAEFEAFKRWQESNGGAPANSVDLDELDPDTAALIARLQAENEALAAQQRNLALGQAQVGQAQLIDTIEQSAALFAEQYGLTAAEMEQVQASAAQLQIIPRLVEAGRVKAPSGVLIQDADYAQVMREAFEAGIAAHPTLRQKIVEAEVARRLSAERAANEATEGKKSRASSLAAIPSAALSRDPSAGRTLSPVDMQAAIAAELRRSMNGGGEN